MLPETLQFRRDSEDLTRSLVRAWGALWPALDMAALDSSFPRWLVAAAGVVGQGRADGAALAAEYLRNFTDHPAESPDVLDPARFAAAMRVTGPVAVKTAMSNGASIPEASATAFSASAGSASRLVLDAGRDVVTKTAIADPNCQGWRRVGSGACNFCAMLIGRGTVYTAGSVSFRSHDRCHCAAEYVTTAGVAGSPVARPVPPPPAIQLFDPSTIRAATNVREIGDAVQKMLGDRSKVEGFELPGLHVERIKSAAEHFTRLMHRFPQVEANFAVTRENAGQALARVKAGGRVAFGDRAGERLRDQMQLPAARFGERARIGSSIKKAAKDGWFHIHDLEGADLVGNTISHEFGHLLAFQRPGGRLNVRAIQDRVMARHGIAPDSREAAAFLKKNRSGYAATDPEETIAEAFADVETNGDHATELSRAIYDDLVSAYRQATS